MNYPEEIREKYNECMFDERDIIEKFLKDQYDLRYGRQRDTWHFEPAIEMMLINGEHVIVHNIGLDENVFVKFFCEDVVARMNEFECTAFAYGELSKVIEALPDASEINKKNAINDLKVMTKNYKIDAILQEYPYKFNGNSIKDIEDMGEEGIKLILDTKSFTLDTSAAITLRDHLNVSILHGYNEYRKLVKFLSEQPNLYFVPANFGDVVFAIYGTDVKVDVLYASLDSNGKLQICCNDGKENIFLDEKDIRPEYLVNLVGYIEDHYWSNIMDGYNGHDIILVNKINKAWKNEQYHDLFGGILLALLYRDHEEYIEKYGEIDDYSEEYVMVRAHHILENICDDKDLETILSFIRYE